MSDDDVQFPPQDGDPHAPIPFPTPRRRRRRWDRLRPPKPDGRWRARRAKRREKRARRTKPRVRKLRLLLILTGLGTLAFVSTVFGMMMAVASDIPEIEHYQQYRQDLHNSFLYDDHWRPIGILAPPNNVVIDQYNDISWYMTHAIVAVEDKRFWSDPGVDIRGIARAFVADVTGGATQGASTITEEFVKNALAEQNNRTIFEKLREAALAYHLTRKWSKEKILTEYLNSIYFGNGAYGIESAARVYFGKKYGYDATSGIANTTTGDVGCGDSTPTVIRHKCASKLAPADAALLAGIVAAPSAFDPIANPAAAKARRDLVLKDMLAQHWISQQQYVAGKNSPLPTASDLEQPTQPSSAPYFTSWLQPQIVTAMQKIAHVPLSVAEYRAYYGGLKIRTTLDLDMQKAAEQAISAELPTGYGLPSASMVVIDNKTGEVRAMVGGPIVDGEEDYTQYPFNLATEGRRQPGSSFKPFTLTEALITGDYGPDSVIASAPQDFIVPDSAGKEHFIVHNFGNAYSGEISLTNATAYSDNSVYAQVGIHVGTGRIARLARRMGIRSPVSNNYAMILGGLKIGVSPLDMAHAYETFATGGNRVFNPTLGAPKQGPTGIAEIQCPICTTHKLTFDKPTYKRIIPATIAKTVHDMLEGVVHYGTGTSAAIPGVDVVGKTGTTSNYGDAWFVGWTPQLTAAVWVGYPTTLKSMATDFNGQPVEGGTYPAIIWHTFMVQALQILAAEQAQKAHKNPSTSSTGNSTANVTDTGSAAGTPAPAAPANGVSGSGGTGSAGGAAGATNGGTGGGGGTAGGGTGGGGGTPGGATGGGGGTAGGGATGGGGGTAGGGATGGGGGTAGGGATGGGGGTAGGGGGATGGGGGTGGSTGGSGSGGVGVGG
jgi:penicillin-binding protein 1A